MTIPKIIFVSNESELKEIKEFADDSNQWEEDSEDILYDFIDQFVIISIEEYKRGTTNKTELNQAIVKGLLSKIIDAFYSNPFYGDTTEVESKEAEKENLLHGIYNELNWDILK